MGRIADGDSTSLIAEYAYVLRPGGILYTVTDVKGMSASFLSDWR